MSFRKTVVLFLITIFHFTNLTAQQKLNIFIVESTCEAEGLYHVYALII